jgi:hypothetical protein
MNKDLSAHLTKKEESAIKQEQVEEGSEQQTDTAVSTATITSPPITTIRATETDTKNLNIVISATTTTAEDVATTAVASSESMNNTNTTPLLLQQEATPSEEPIVTPKEEDFLLNL